MVFEECDNGVTPGACLGPAHMGIAAAIRITSPASRDLTIAM
jgi:hypothetical protein